MDQKKSVFGPKKTTPHPIESLMEQAKNKKYCFWFLKFCTTIFDFSFWFLFNSLLCLPSLFCYCSRCPQSSARTGFISTGCACRRQELLSTASFLTYSLPLLCTQDPYVISKAKSKTAKYRNSSSGVNFILRKNILDFFKCLVTPLLLFLYFTVRTCFLRLHF